MWLKNSRDAFSMVTAVVVIILMSTVAMFVVSLSGKITQETVNQFQREQAILLAKSYTEYAIMAVMSNDRTVNCLEDINSNENVAGEYNIQTRIAYIGNNTTVGNCSNTRIFSKDVATTMSPLNIIIDVYVKYKILNHHDTTKDHWMTYHRRTLQKI